ncbi:hypothetical protein [Streptomyces sp. H27-C3]|uniref:hypothetical protein n=1 Tax=Streptomyces sp. H27-C3 TaxID=3046305 RepID=UPI0024BAD5F5|nr:hypothetical protein [Streptomyces sp. H27-C3]MDJ0461990.1 hypothetical protein [Streptomyces sp. H27-C3]
MKFTTADGSTVEVTRVGIRSDIHVRDAAGRTVATVTMNGHDTAGLLTNLRANT